jgi:biotin carboxyl carrier protein
MKVEIEFAGKTRTVEVESDASDGGRRGRVRGKIDGRAIEADAVEVTPGVYSILIDSASFEVRVEPHAGALGVTVAGQEYQATIRDPRQWRRRRGAGFETEGRQQVVAPMPGKVVRVLAKAGQTVETGQGILVIEAMKMQNEVRSPKAGTVERVLVSENQAVSAGETLAVIA